MQNLMIFFLKGIWVDVFLFSVNVNVNLKFLWALKGFSEGSWSALMHLGIQRALVQGHSEGTRALKALGNSDI